MVENSTWTTLESVLKEEIIKCVFQPIRNDIETKSINRINQYSDFILMPEMISDNFLSISLTSNSSILNKRRLQLLFIDDKNPENETISKILNSLYSQLYRLNQDERTVDNMLGILISNINIQEASNYFPVSLKSRIDTVVISNSWNGSYPFKYTKPDSFIEMFIESDNYKKSISIIKKYLALQML